VLVIAGSDSGAGAGIQADIKTVMALGGYATTAITALTAQNSFGVQAAMPVPPAFLRAQIEAVLSDIGADCAKIGMLGTGANVAVVADCLALHPNLPVVLDPVRLAKGGAALLDDDALAVFIESLLPRATLLTPNIPEAEILTGQPIRSLDDRLIAARALLGLGPRAVLLKGGHWPGDRVTDLLLTADGVTFFHAPRQATRHTHGTGCTLASAVATGLAQGLNLSKAVQRAHSYVQRAIAAAPGLGGGQGPLQHDVPPES